MKSIELVWGRVMGACGYVVDRQTSFRRDHRVPLCGMSYGQTEGDNTHLESSFGRVRLLRLARRVSAGLATGLATCFAYSKVVRARREKNGMRDNRTFSACHFKFWMQK